MCSCKQRFVLFAVLVAVLTMSPATRANVRATAIIFRHGQRTPIKSVPSFNNTLTKELGHGQLTNVSDLEMIYLIQVRMIWWMTFQFRSEPDNSTTMEHCYEWNTNTCSRATGYSSSATCRSWAVHPRGRWWVCSRSWPVSFHRHWQWTTRFLSIGSHSFALSINKERWVEMGIVKRNAAQTHSSSHHRWFTLIPGLAPDTPRNIFRWSLILQRI